MDCAVVIDDAEAVTSSANEYRDFLQEAIAKKDDNPGIINAELLQRMIRAQGPKGEAARLCRNISIDYSAITTLCLEFLNIVKIDQLWLLPNIQILSLKCNKIEKIENLDVLSELRELNLSFNCIERIENLERLAKLKYLTLFGNRIRRIEHLEELQNLVRLSIRNNNIDSVEGINRLRLMLKLFSLNLEGNPIVTKLDGNVNFREFIAAYLPQLKYYNYSIITDAEREQGRKTYKRQLRLLEASETEEKALKAKEIDEARELERLTECFVEHLNDFQLADALLQHDDNLNLSQLDVKHLTEVCRNQIYSFTQEIYQMGIENYSWRCQEILEYEEALRVAREEVQLQGIELVTKLLLRTDDLTKKTEGAFRSLADSHELQILAKIRFHVEQLEALERDYDVAVDEAWFVLMELETSLHERIQETSEKFASNLRQTMDTFMHRARSKFGQIKMACGEYLKFVAQKCADDELLINAVSHLRTHSTETIEQRKNTLVSRCSDWLTSLLAKYETAESIRHRLKILEIRNFTNAKRSAYSELKDKRINEFQLSKYFCVKSILNDLIKTIN